jgi:AcrR family transcriptional regulator
MREPETQDQPRKASSRKDSKRDPEQTVKRIVAAARAEFARSGYDGARMDRVSEMSGMSKGLLYHHFGSKENLFVAVLEDIYQELRSQNDELILEDVEPEVGIRNLIEHTFRYFAEHPDFIVLVNSENSMKADHLKRTTAVGRMFGPLAQRLRELIDRGADQGIFRRDVDAIELYVSIVGLGYFFLANRWTLSVVFDRDLLGECEEERRLAHITEVILGYLRHPTPQKGN